MYYVEIGFEDEAEGKEFEEFSEHMFEEYLSKKQEIDILKGLLKSANKTIDDLTKENVKFLFEIKELRTVAKQLDDYNSDMDDYIKDLNIKPDYKIIELENKNRILDLANRHNIHKSLRYEKKAHRYKLEWGFCRRKLNRIYTWLENILINMGMTEAEAKEYVREFRKEI